MGRLRVAGECEVAVVGGGVAGSSLAYLLAAAGRHVVLLEAGHIGDAASGRNLGAVRQHGRTEHDLGLATRAAETWAALDAECGGFEYRRGGDLLVATSEAEMRRVEVAVEFYRRAGLGVSLVDRRGALDIVPGLGPCVVGGSFCPSDAQVNPILGTRAFAARAAARGARVWEHTPVTGFVQRGGVVTGVRTPTGVFRCHTAVICAGPWSAGLGRLAGVDIPVIPRRSHVMVTEPMPPMFSAFLSGNMTYACQTKSGNLLFGVGGVWEHLGFDRRSTLRAMGRMATRLCGLLPGIRDAMVIRAFAGTVEITLDLVPLVGPAPGAGGLLLHCGFSGNGMGSAPGASRLLADYIMGRGCLSPDLDPGRFLGTDPMTEYHRRYDMHREPDEGPLPLDPARLLPGINRGPAPARAAGDAP